MPYAVLVTVLGAITSTAIAMFVLHSWSAMKIAPPIGAMIGLAMGVLTLKLRGLSLSVTLEQFRAARSGESATEAIQQCLKIALGTAIIVSIAEVPVIVFNNGTLPLLAPAGGIVVTVYTFHRAWRMNVHELIRGNLDVFHLVGGLAIIGICSALMVIAFEGLQSGTMNTEVSAFFLVKTLFVWNSFAAFDAAAIAFFGICILDQILALTKLRKYR